MKTYTKEDYRKMVEGELAQVNYPTEEKRMLVDMLVTAYQAGYDMGFTNGMTRASEVHTNVMETIWKSH